MFEKDHKDTPCVIFTNNVNDTFFDAIAIYEIVQIHHMMFPVHHTYDIMFTIHHMMDWGSITWSGYIIWWIHFLTNLLYLWFLKAQEVKSVVKLFFQYLILSLSYSCFSHLEDLGRGTWGSAKNVRVVQPGPLLVQFGAYLRKCSKTSTLGTWRPIVFNVLRWIKVCQLKQLYLCFYV